MLGVGERTLDRRMISSGLSVSHKLQGCKKEDMKLASKYVRQRYHEEIIKLSKKHAK